MHFVEKEPSQKRVDFDQKLKSNKILRVPGAYNPLTAKLIQESDCKGLAVGDALISSLHANFIINKGKATATDIENLGNLVKNRVYKKFNILLDWEIKIIGEKN